MLTLQDLTKQLQHKFIQHITVHISNMQRTNGI